MQAAHGQPERPFLFFNGGGMGDEKQEGLAVQIATLTQQMRSVQPFANPDRGFAEMRVRSESVREDVRLLWTRSQAEERDRGIVRRPSGRAGSAKLVSPASRRNSARTLRF